MIFTYIISTKFKARSNKFKKILKFESFIAKCISAWSIYVIVSNVFF